MPKAMRTYRPGSVLCDGCRRPIVVSREEWVTRPTGIYHVLCIPKAAA